MFSLLLFLCAQAFTKLKRKLKSGNRATMINSDQKYMLSTDNDLVFDDDSVLDDEDFEDRRAEEERVAQSDPTDDDKPQFLRATKEDWAQELKCFLSRIQSETKEACYTFFRNGQDHLKIFVPVLNDIMRNHLFYVSQPKQTIASHHPTTIPTQSRVTTVSRAKCTYKKELSVVQATILAEKKKVDSESKKTAKKRGEVVSVLMENASRRNGLHSSSARTHRRNGGGKGRKKGGEVGALDENAIKNAEKFIKFAFNKKWAQKQLKDAIASKVATDKNKAAKAQRRKQRRKKEKGETKIIPGLQTLAAISSEWRRETHGERGLVQRALPDNDDDDDDDEFDTEQLVTATQRRDDRVKKEETEKSVCDAAKKADSDETTYFVHTMALMAGLDVSVEEKKKKMKKRKHTTTFVVEPTLIKTARQKLSGGNGDNTDNACRARAFGILSDKKEIEKALERTELCRSVTGFHKRRCYHGDKCRYAHTIEELLERACRFKASCRFVYHSGNGNYKNQKNRFNKKCSCFHPLETKKSFCRRLNLPFTTETGTTKPAATVSKTKKTVQIVPITYLNAVKRSSITPVGAWVSIVKKGLEAEETRLSKHKETAVEEKKTVTEETEETVEEKTVADDIDFERVYGPGFTIMTSYGFAPGDCLGVKNGILHPIKHTTTRKSTDRRGLGCSRSRARRSQRGWGTVINWVKGVTMEPEKQARCSRWDITGVSQPLVDHPAMAAVRVAASALNTAVISRVIRSINQSLSSSPLILRVPKAAAQAALVSAINSGISNFKIIIID
jgi:hypothetical protein